MRLDIRRVRELIHEECIGVFARDALGDVLVVLRMSLRNIRASEDHLSTHRA